MFGKIKIIDQNIITIENISGKTLSSLINCHLILMENNRRIVGEVIYVDLSIIKLLLVGEITNNQFTAGISKKPSGTSEIRIITLQELELIFGKSNFSKERLYLGKSTVYNNLNISINLNDFFAYHNAIIGNTGSGKSCGVARILQNLFVLNPYKPKNAHIILFDAYGEYTNTFNEINQFGLNFANYKVKGLLDSKNQLYFPAYFLDADDLAILLNVTSGDQLPTLNKTLKLVNIFKSNDPTIKDYKNDIIANCILDILTSGRTSTQIRDQIIAVLSNYNTETLNLNSIIHQPGYDRTLRQCLLIDEQGKINAIHEVVSFFQKYNKINLDNITINNNLLYNLDDLYYALEFALISEGNINNDQAYKQNNIMKTRLKNIINSEENKVFNYGLYISKEDYIKKLFNQTQIINIDLSNLDDHFAKTLTKLLSKLMFNYTTSINNRGYYAINIILEEAHRYVQNDNDINVIGYNIFDRITKEGRKYGTMLTFITQRPSELSTTALSQCANFIAFRITHPNDLNMVKSISSNVSIETIEQLKSLNPGTALCFGNGFKIPTMIKFNLPSPMPISSSVDISNIWYLLN